MGKASFCPWSIRALHSLYAPYPQNEETLFELHVRPPQPEARNIRQTNTCICFSQAGGFRPHLARSTALLEPKQSSVQGCGMRVQGPGVGFIGVLGWNHRYHQHQYHPTCHHR